MKTELEEMLDNAGLGELLKTLAEICQDRALAAAGDRYEQDSWESCSLICKTAVVSLQDLPDRDE